MSAPQSGDYSTVYIGGTGAEFAQWGHFLGLAEDVDTGNQIHTDNAFVFSGNIAVNGLSAAQYGEEIAGIVAHEIGHLIGTELAHPVIAGNPLTAVAAVGDPIPDEVKDALIGTATNPGGLQKLFDLGKSINLPAVQTRSGLDKSVAQLLPSTPSRTAAGSDIGLFDGGDANLPGPARQFRRTICGTDDQRFELTPICGSCSLLRRISALATALSGTARAASA
jgi:hypothetical protein